MVEGDMARAADLGWVVALLLLRSALSHRLDLYSVPQLHFAYDDSIESGMRLSQLIDDAVAADKKLSN